MKNHLLIIALAMTTGSMAQTIGWNGQGWLENQTEQSKEWIDAVVGDQEFVVRFPGGAATKYTDPISGSGWGINYELVDSITYSYGSEEEEATSDAVAKWRRKADEQPAYSYLDDIIAMQNRYPSMKVIWSANYLIPTDRAIYPIEYLLQNGVNLAVVEIGNESYSQVDYDFQMYWERSQPLVAAIKAKGLPVAYPIPATGVRNSWSHAAWIAELNEVIDGDGAVAHPYYGGREFPALNQPVDTAAAAAQIAAFDFNAQFDEIKSNLPNAGFFIVTESNSQPASLIGGTELNALLVDRLLQEGKKHFQYFLIHNGVAPDLYGIIYGTARTGGQKRNTTYYSFERAFTQSCDTLITPATYDTTYTTITPAIDDRCNKFWFNIFNWKKCRPVPVTITTITEVTPADTVINCPEEDPETGCIDQDGTSPDNQECKTGSNDDYLNPQRFVDGNGNCYCDDCGVMFDHRINTKFVNTIIPDIARQTGITINTDLVDFYITLPETNETVVFYDIFNWCIDGKPAPFNTNAELYKVWPDFLTGKSTHTFNVLMLDRETGLNISELWEGHTTMVLKFSGLW